MHGDHPGPSHAMCNQVRGSTPQASKACDERRCSAMCNGALQCAMVLCNVYRGTTCCHKSTPGRGSSPVHAASPAASQLIEYPVRVHFGGTCACIKVQIHWKLDAKVRAAIGPHPKLSMRHSLLKAPHFTPLPSFQLAQYTHSAIGLCVPPPAATLAPNHPCAVIHTQSSIGTQSSINSHPNAVTRTQSCIGTQSSTRNLHMHTVIHTQLMCFDIHSLPPHS